MKCLPYELHQDFFVHSNHAYIVQLIKITINQQLSSDSNLYEFIYGQAENTIFNAYR